MFPTERRWSHLLRTVFLAGAMTLTYLAIARLPLATAVSAFLISPIVAVVLSTIVLKERLTARKLLALALGARGSLVILRPGGSTDPAILLAFGAGLLFALYIGVALTGYVAFGEIPTWPTIIGATFIVAAGLVLLRSVRPREES